MGSIDETDNIGPIHCGTDAAKHFAFAEGYRNLNHGSYGTYPLSVRSVFRDYQERAEARPDHFVRYEYRTGLLDKSRAAIADYIGAPDDSCVLVPNATTGIETVLRNLVFEPGDVVVVFNDLYPAFANTLDYLSRTATGLEVYKIAYKLPVSDHYICERFENVVKDLKAQHKHPKLALLDTISSFPGVRMPFERLIALCKTSNILSLVDGAHSVGQISLNLRQLDPDFFVSNLHKWLHVPRGCSVLYVPDRNQGLLRTTLPTGFFYGEAFVKNFSDTGTMDTTPYLCVPAALKWRERIQWGDKQGDEAIKGYIQNLAREGGAIVAKILRTYVLENQDKTLGQCSLTNIALPLDQSAITGGDDGKVGAVSQWMMQTMIEEYETAVLIYTYDRKWWVRLSGQVYLTMDDFEYAGQKLKEMCGRVVDMEWEQ